MRDKIFVIVILIILIVIPLCIFAREEKSISVAENRNLYKKSDIKLSNVNEDLEKYLQDQFIFGERLKMFYNKAKNKITNFSVDFIEKNNMMELIPVGDDLYRLANTDYLVNRPKKANEYKETYHKIIDSINKKSEENPNIKFYVYNIVTDNTIQNKEEFNGLITEKLNKNIKFLSSTKINTYEDYKNSFYKTDHHWSKDGQYDGYIDLMNLLGINDKLKIKGIKKFDNIKFYGSKDRLLGNYDIYDELIVNEYEYPKMNIENDYIEVEDYGKHKEFIEGKIPNESVEINYYGEYYGWDNGIIKFQVPQNEKKENLMVFANSYSNPINKLIASSFYETYVVDLRNYELELKEEFSFDKFIKEHHVDKILILGNYNYFVTEQSIIK